MEDYFKNKKDTNQRPGESYNMFASLAAGIPSVVMGVDAYMKRNEARDNLKTQQGYVDTLMKQYMETPIYNPYENLSVATQANQIKMEETDKALANTLDTLRAQGASAGGATALAQAALKSKAGIAADIEKQEVMNERLKAQGEIMVQNAEMQRKGQQMDYEQSKADQSRMEQFAYGERAADMAGALGSLGLQVARGLGDGKSETTTDTTADTTVDYTPPEGTTQGYDEFGNEISIAPGGYNNASNMSLNPNAVQPRKTIGTYGQSGDDTIEEGDVGLTLDIQPNPQASGPRVPGAITLSQYYQGLGQSLPSPADRATLYEQAGLGSASSYKRSASQNTALLEYLQNR